jgi:superfamily II DNA or RNA helicase
LINREAREQLAVGSLVEVRGQRWVVADIDEAASTLVELQSVEDGRYADTLSVIWEVEPRRRVLPTSSLPDVDRNGFDPPDQLAAFLDAVRWGAVTSADINTLQAPFRSGIAIEDYQLEPVARALPAPRVNLLLADDVGLGKTIEAGLVVQELLLRHRARRVMVVCPAGLTVKWQAEMAEKFGQEFTIVDSAQCAVLRRTHGSAANPFRVYPLVVVSLAWLRSPRAQRLLDEVLPPEGPAERREFDVLILDEAHHVAPSAPRQRYAVDSQQTKLIRRIAPHFEHRLFLSATPHNGYPESFTALLELIDDQRFARGMEPDPVAQHEVVVRRLKRDIVEDDGTPRFRERTSLPIEVEYPEHEREIHALLSRFAASRARRLGVSRRGRRAADLVTLLLKKRLFSSPLAFEHTVGVYLETLRGTRARHAAQHAALHASADDVPEWLDSFFADVADLDDEELAEEEDTALHRAGPMQPSAAADEVALLERMEDWARNHSANPDAKAAKLIEYLNAVCRPDGRLWTNERVVVFTEYRDTQRWLVRLLGQEGLAGDHIAQLHGGMAADEREALRQAFQADPSEHPVRILVATDAASEGIDLHWHCHRVVNFDIPFNPNKLEQRIGRIDRYGQRVNPEIRHFVGAGWQRAGDSYEADLEFLSRVARKVAQMEEDLGAVNAVLADAVQRRMLGEAVDVDGELQKKGRQRRHGRVASDANVGEQVRRLRRQLDETVEALDLTPAAVQRVVTTALHLARQEPLTAAHDPDEVFDVPPLTGTWVRAAAGLAHPLRPEQLRPVTFDPEIARQRREDVVFAHLNHPLVAMSTRLLRAAVSSRDTDLHRVTAVVSDDPELAEPLVAAYARFLLVGGDGIRLHEEVLYAGGWLRVGGRFARLENLTTLGAILGRALAAGAPVPGHVRARLANAWPRARDGVVAALDWRAGQRRLALDNKLTRRREDEERRITDNLDRFAATLRDALRAEPDEAQLEFDYADEVERAQRRRDQAAWRDRLDRLAADRERDLATIRARYADPRPHMFPVAVVFVVPRREVIR